MIGTMTQEEIETLTEVVKEYLTDLRSEILDTDGYDYKQALKHKEEVLRVVHAKLERESQSIRQFLTVS
jgi:hypothetical protein